MPVDMLPSPPDILSVTKSNGDAAFFTISEILPVRLMPLAKSFADSSIDCCNSTRSLKVLSKNCVVDSITLILLNTLAGELGNRPFTLFKAFAGPLTCACNPSINAMPSILMELKALCKSN